MGTIWPRALAPSGPTLRARAPKLSIVKSFVVAIAILLATFPTTQELHGVRSLCFFYMLRQDSTTPAHLSSGRYSDFWRIYRSVRRCSSSIASVQRLATVRHRSHTLGYTLAKPPIEGVHNNDLALQGADC